MLIKRFIFFIILLCFGINTSYASYGQRVAFSKRYGIEFFVDRNDEKWCGRILKMTVVAKDKDFFSSPDFSYIFSKTMKTVIEEKECKTAEIAGIKAFDAKESVIYNVVSVKSDGWIPHIAKDNFDELLENDIYDDEKEGSNSDWQINFADKIIVSSSNVYDHEIKTKDGKCAIRYTLPKSSNRTKNWYLVVENNDCKDYYLNGKASIKIFNEKGRLLSRGTGYFSKGYFTEDRFFDVKFLERYAYGIENQRLNYLIDTDDINKVYFISYLRSEYRKKYDKFTKWHGCDPFVISAVTDNTDIFLDDKDIDDIIIDGAKDYAAAYCPDSTVIKVFGVKKTSGIYGVDIPFIVEDDAWKTDPDFYFGTVLYRNSSTGAFIVDDKKTKNRIQYDEIIRTADKMVVMDSLDNEYFNLLNASFKDKLAYMLNVEKLDNVKSMLMASNQNNNDSVYVNMMINVADADGISSKSFYPVPMINKCKGKLLCEQGWYLVSGYLKSLSDNEKSMHSFEKYDFAGEFIPENAIKCENSFCLEANNVLTMVQKRHKRFDFIPKREDRP